MQDATEVKTYVAVCCGTPLIWTFMFSKAEWFCRVCRTPFPMLNTERVDVTAELLLAKEENERWFDDIAKDCIPYRSRLCNCAKCDGGEDHLDHATDDEIERSGLAYQRLQSEWTKMGEQERAAAERLRGGEYGGGFKIKDSSGYIRDLIVTSNAYLDEYPADENPDWENWTRQRLIEEIEACREIINEMII